MQRLRDYNTQIERREFARAQEADFTVTDSLVFGHSIDLPEVTRNDSASLTDMGKLSRRFKDALGRPD